MRSACAIGAVLMLAACTPQHGAGGDAGAPAAPPMCARFGQTCEFEPGKLGTCVPRTGCTTDDCLICQSQH